MTTATPDTPIEILAREAQRIGAVVDHDLAAIDDADAEQSLMDALDLGVEDIGLGV
jgi:hypothetical protein